MKLIFQWGLWQLAQEFLLGKELSLLRKMPCLWAPSHLGAQLSVNRNQEIRGRGSCSAWEESGISCSFVSLWIKGTNMSKVQREQRRSQQDRNKPGRRWEESVPPWGGGVAKEEVKYLLCCNENSHLQHCLPMNYYCMRWLSSWMQRSFNCTFVHLYLYPQEHVFWRPQGRRCACAP